MYASKCSTVYPMLADFTEGRIAPSDARIVEEHLRECDSCRATVKSLASLFNDVLPQSRKRDARIDWSTFRVAVNEGIDRRKKRAVLFTPAVYLPAAAVIAIVAVLWFAGRPQTPDASAPRMAETLLFDQTEIEEIRALGNLDLAGHNLTPTGVPNSYAAAGHGELTDLLDEDVLTAEYDEAFAESVGRASLFAAGVDLLSAEAVLETLDEDDVALLASALESNPIIP